MAHIFKELTEMTADTKYPIMLVHGMGFRDRKHLCYWGRIPKILRRNGARVFFGWQDSNGSIESNARQIEVSLKKVLSETGAERSILLLTPRADLKRGI